MPYTLSLIDVESRDLVVAALRAGADQRSRAAERIAKIVRSDKAARKDVRPDSVRVTILLGEAAELRAAADTLATAEDTALVAYVPPPDAPAIVDAATGDPVLIGLGTPPEDDGTSPQAQAMAELANLTGYDPDTDEVDIDTFEVQP